jgi:2-polyprenyl-3-methyl-5-hydroxy-6-metoxy-1,4-benzoquinol methylase
VFTSHERLFPTRGEAIDLACGRGLAAVWLATRGLNVHGVDVSPVALRAARDMAARQGVADRCRFEVADLDAGLPAGLPADVVVCHLFRDVRLYHAIIQRLSPGGLLAMAVLSEVDQGPGPFRAAPGELRSAFGALSILADGEAGGTAWLLARRPGESGSELFSANAGPGTR